MNDDPTTPSANPATSAASSAAAGPTAAISSEERNWALAAHACGLLWLFGGGSLLFFPVGTLVLFTILGPLIIWRAKRETMPFASEQAREALNFQITVWLLGMLSCLFLIVGIGFVMLWALGLTNVILAIIAAIKVSDGVAYRYPFALRLVS